MRASSSASVAATASRRRRPSARTGRNGSPTTTDTRENHGMPNQRRNGNSLPPTPTGTSGTFVR